MAGRKAFDIGGLQSKSLKILDQEGRLASPLKEFGVRRLGHGDIFPGAVKPVKPDQQLPVAVPGRDSPLEIDGSLDSVVGWACFNLQAFKQCHAGGGP
ncbi:hypothetical protein MAE02_41010 [Microvirga aerophila]|uniref:Uncharacterized protein n=1 Tax=Microvirga aerophila TaxID=670291 RepID=A0A512BWU3_9HYPH|nr:hypothetical protein MAE02_41010 [Microvirga aerophila]